MTGLSLPANWKSPFTSPPNKILQSLHKLQADSSWLDMLEMLDRVLQTFTFLQLSAELSMANGKHLQLSPTVSSSHQQNQSSSLHLTRGY